ncbi:S26 family signal peptidase [Rhodobacter sp. SGA-6-6]|uniref:S26 family signal peptidase n=1 Tax=Rhodobacter sp. SGA-6-6 TaxID=2710882 RepID=UPI0013EBCFE1|nr:S26 family signal peptidase [Rhodobacter sp. SGA-6-6]NGM47776.1 S26 family signal peptidase [Rhodobacter sp. SGA-6-6]
MTRRRLTLAVMLAGALLIAAPDVTSHAPRLVWNASASAPVGLYAATPITSLEVGDLVAVTPPDDLAIFLAERGYLPRGVPLIKRVLALPGTEVCRSGTTILAHGRAWGEAQARDRLGRDLPRWQGCRGIAARELFLMNWDAPDSLDGRYFGPLPITSITARLSPIWTDRDGDRRFEWWAQMR